MTDAVRIGIVSVSDRASTGVYEDKGLPALQDWLTRALRNPIHFEPRLIPDEQQRISDTLVELVDAGTVAMLPVLEVRLAASELALRAAQSAALHAGAKGYLMRHAAQRHSREALFVAIVTPAIKHLRLEIECLRAQG